MGKKKISLVIYGLSVINEKNKRMFLDNLIENRSLLNVVEEYIKKNISRYSKDSSKEILFQFEKVDTEIINNANGQEQYKVLYGRVKTGEYGIESELVDVQTGTITNKTQNQADMMPFGFCLAVPDGRINSAVLILQTMGVYGMKVSLQKHLKNV